ncbi:hypothetical protein LIER_31910 [Lithospermum erythrorhizon]|uniref:DUF4283 domain-containing protein n=1 Tax=Lithospermum erythrorhizon TaxID=34254 RepID=A0AAV3RWB7_LITER
MEVLTKTTRLAFHNHQALYRGGLSNRSSPDSASKGGLIRRLFWLRRVDAKREKLKFGAFVEGMESLGREAASGAILAAVNSANGVDGGVVGLDSQVDENFPPLAQFSRGKMAKRNKGNIVGKGGNLGAAENSKVNVQEADLAATNRPKSTDPEIQKPGLQLRKSASFGSSKGLGALVGASSKGVGDDLRGPIPDKVVEKQNLDGSAVLVTDVHATSQVLASLGLGMEGLFDDDVTRTPLFQEVLDATEARLVDGVAADFYGARRSRRSRKHGGPSEGFALRQGMDIFQFHSKEDRDKVFNDGILDANLFLDIPLWVKFYDVPLRYWTEIGLNKISSNLGKPLYTDQFTCERSRASFARVLVEVDMRYAPIHEFPIHLAGGIIHSQRVSYEDFPEFCCHCQSFRHHYERCLHLKVSEIEEMPEQGLLQEGGGANKGAPPPRATPAIPVAQIVADPTTLCDDERRTIEGGLVLSSRPAPPMFDSSSRTAYHSGSSSGPARTGEYSCSLGDSDTDSSSTTINSVEEKGRFVLVRRRGSSLSKGHDRGEDKRGGKELTAYLLDDLKEFMMATELVDAPTSGSFYTWTNGSLWSKLDRVLMNPMWNYLGLMCRVEFLPMEPTSDHYPVLARGRVWGFSDKASRAKEAFKAAIVLQMATPDDMALKEEVRVLRERADFLMQAKRSSFRQKVSYLVKGDDIRTTSKEEVATMLVDFFTRLMETAYPSTSIDLDVLRAGLLVGTDSQTVLVAPIFYDEVGWAMFDIGDERAPGPDGFTGAFFKTNWDTVREDVVRAVREFNTTGRLLRQLNHTIIALIPKTYLYPGVGEAHEGAPF